MAPLIQNGSIVTLHYTLTVDGRVIDSSRNGQPFTFVQGNREIIHGLESSLMNLGAGAKVVIDVAPEDGYGHRDPAAVAKVPRASFQSGDQLKVGDMVRGQQGSEAFEARVQEIGDSFIMLDMNHPLADKTLRFDIEIVAVQPAASEPASA